MRLMFDISLINAIVSSVYIILFYVNVLGFVTFHPYILEISVSKDRPGSIFFIVLPLTVTRITFSEGLII